MKTKTLNHKMKAGIVLGVLLGTLIIASGITSATTLPVNSEKTHNKPEITPLDGVYIITDDDQYDNEAYLIVYIPFR